MYKDAMTGKKYENKEEYIQEVIRDRQRRLRKIEENLSSMDTSLFRQMNQLVSLVEEYEEMKETLFSKLQPLTALVNTFTPKEKELWDRCLSSCANELCI